QRSTNTSLLVHYIGRADREKETEYNHYPQLPGETSLLDLPDKAGVSVNVLTGRLTTGDDFCARLGVSAIDLLKIDVEGMESAVLAGFQRMLASGSIGAIQFEYQFVNPVTRFLLKNF